MPFAQCYARALQAKYEEMFEMSLSRAIGKEFHGDMKLALRVSGRNPALMVTCHVVELWTSLSSTKIQSVCACMNDVTPIRSAFLAKLYHCGTPALPIQLHVLEPRDECCTCRHQLHGICNVSGLVCDTCG